MNDFDAAASVVRRGRRGRAGRRPRGPRRPHVDRVHPRRPDRVGGVRRPRGRRARGHRARRRGLPPGRRRRRGAVAARTTATRSRPAPSSAEVDRARCASILTGERVALNFLCHCSGVASVTRRYVRAARGKARILDTRKTLPGLRGVQRAAVRAGGGFNHRDSLSDRGADQGQPPRARSGLAKAVERARARWPVRGRRGRVRHARAGRRGARRPASTSCCSTT